MNKLPTGYIILLIFGLGCLWPGKSGNLSGQDLLMDRSELPSGTDSVSYYYLEAARINLFNRYADSTDSSKRLLKRALELDENHAPSHFELASLYWPEYPGEAIRHSYAANRLDPGNIWYKNQLGEFYLYGGQYDSALVVYNEILELAPNNPETYSYLSALYDHTDQTFTAIALLDSAEVRFGIIEELAFFKRELLLKTGLIDRAIEETRVLTHTFPFDEKNFVILGELYSKKGADSLAIEAFNQALTIDSTNVYVLHILNQYHLSRNDLGNFLVTAKKMLELDDIELDYKIEFAKNVVNTPQLYQAYFSRVNDIITGLAVKYPDNLQVIDVYATHKIHSGDPQGALGLYKNMLDESADIGLYYRVIELETYLKNQDSMMRYIDLALRRFPEENELHLRKGYGLLYLGQYDSAVKAIENALKYTRSDSMKSVYYALIGDIYYAQDPSDMKKYSRAYEKAIKHNPDNIVALNNFSYYLSLAGKNLDKALEMIVKVIELEPGNPTYIDTHGWILFKLGRTEEARTVMRQAISLDAGENSELMIHYGDILFELEEYLMARIYWQKALEKGYDPEEIEKRFKSAEGK